MDFDEIKTIWKEVDRGTPSTEGIERSLLHGLGTDRVRSSLAGMRFGLAFEIVAGVGAALLTGSYLAAHVGEPRFLVPALVLHVAALVLVAVPTRQLVALRAMDYGQPVVSLQKRLSAFRLSRVREGAWLFILGPLLWTPLAIVSAHGLLGIDIYAGFGMPWVIANLALGVAVLATAIWISRRYGDRLRGSRVWRSVSDGLAGRSLVVAQSFLADVAAFERRE